MRKRFLFKVCIPAIVMIVVFVLTLNIPIFKVSNKLQGSIKRNIDFNEKNNMCILKYTYTTGPGWVVEDTNIRQLVCENVCLYSVFDPRLLKDNEEFDLDYLGKLIVVVDKVDKTVIDNEEVYVIHPKSVTILYDTNKDRYRIKDMSVGGIIKSLISMINKKFRYSY